MTTEKRKRKKNKVQQTVGFDPTTPWIIWPCGASSTTVSHHLNVSNHGMTSRLGLDTSVLVKPLIFQSCNYSPSCIATHVLKRWPFGECEQILVPRFFPEPGSFINDFLIYMETQEVGIYHFWLHFFCPPTHAWEEEKKFDVAGHEPRSSVHYTMGLGITCS